MAAYVELEDFVTRGSIEYAYRRCQIEQQKGNQAFANVGMRAARARDSRLLKVLDLASNILLQMDEEQNRENRRTTEVYGETKLTTEVQLWREAYKMGDQGKSDDVPHLQWIYGAAALLAGYNC